MGANRENQELFYCRSGMLRRGPFTRKTLRKLLAAGLLDAHSLVGVVGSKVMMPLGSSKAAGEITWVARHWYWQHTVWMYWAWLVFMPLFSAGVSGGAIIYSSKAAFLIPSAIILGNLGMALWLYQKWSMLLADRKNRAWLAAFYALPMAIPVVNFVWIWIGYLKLPKHWRSFKQLHNIPDHTPYFMYYLVMVVWEHI